MVANICNWFQLVAWLNGCLEGAKQTELRRALRTHVMQVSKRSPSDDVPWKSRTSARAQIVCRVEMASFSMDSCSGADWSSSNAPTESPIGHRDDQPSGKCAALDFSVAVCKSSSGGIKTPTLSPRSGELEHLVRGRMGRQICCVGWGGTPETFSMESS